MANCPVCEHIQFNGRRCGSPALRGDTHCYHHQRYKRPAIVPGEKNYQLPPLNHPFGRARLLTDILHGLLSGRVEVQTARTLLQTVKLAVKNAATHPAPRSRRP